MLSFISRSGIFSEIASEIPQSDLCFSEIGPRSKHVNKEQQKFRCQAFHGEEILSKSGSKRSIVQFRHHQTEMIKSINQTNRRIFPSLQMRYELLPVVKSIDHIFANPIPIDHNFRSNSFLILTRSRFLEAQLF